MWISKTIPFIQRNPTNHGIDMQPKSKSPNLFSTALSCWKGRDHFCLEAKALFFFCHQKLEQLQGPQPQQLGGSWPLEKISSPKLFEASQPFSAERKKWIFLAKHRKNIPKRGTFLFRVLCTCKRGPKVRRTAAQYLESHKQTIRYVIADQGKLYVLFFFHNDSKIGIWDILTKRENVPPDKPLKTAATCNPHTCAIHRPSAKDQGWWPLAWNAARVEALAIPGGAFWGFEDFSWFFGGGAFRVFRSFFLIVVLFVAVDLNRWLHWMIMVHVLWYDFF